jgi:hypothetical protein
MVEIPAIGRIQCTASDIGSADRRGATGGGSSFLPGCHVIVACSREDKNGSTNPVFPYTILGSVALFPKPKDTEYIPQAVDEHIADYNNNPIYNILADNDFIKVSRVDRSYNRLLDSLPGDWSMSNPSGTILQIGMFLARIGAGADCNLYFNGLDRSTHLTTEKFFQESTAYLNYVYKEGSKSLRLEQIAFTDYEGLGGIQDDTVKTEDSKVVPIEDNQRGLFRYNSLKGGAVEGSLRFAQVLPPSNSTPNLLTYEEALAGTLRIQERTDGTYRVEAAKEIAFYKTGSIVVPQQKKDPGSLYPEDTELTEDPYLDATDLDIKKQELGIQSDEEYYAYKSLLGTKILKFEEEKYFWQGLRQEGGVWVVPPKGGAEEIAADDASLDTLTPTAPEYTFDTLTRLMTEAIEVSPGRQVKFFKNTSAFIMSEEGSITLGDGMGASIRMENGNLILGSALDIKLQCGRDFVSIVPRNEIHKVGQNAELSCSEGSISLKADKNMHLLAGNSGNGSTIIENRSTENNMNSIAVKDLEEGVARGGGIYIKAPNTGIAAVTSSLVVTGAITNPEDNSTGMDVESTKCAVFIHTGSESFIVQGKLGSLLFSEQLAVGHRDSVAGLYISSLGAILTSNNRVQITAPTLAIEKGDGTVKRPQLSKQGVRSTKVVSFPASDPQVNINGVLKATGNLETKGSVRAEGSVASNLGANPNPTSNSNKVTVSVPAPNPSISLQVLTTDAGAIRDIMRSIVKNGTASDKAQAYSSFCFPATRSELYNVDISKTYFSEMPWQMLLSQNAKKWVEKAVAHSIIGDTYPYPGKQAIEGEAKIIKSLDSTGDKPGPGKPFSDYKINT